MKEIETIKEMEAWPAVDLPKSLTVKATSDNDIMVQQVKASGKRLEESKCISRMIICDLPN